MRLAEKLDWKGLKLNDFVGGVAVALVYVVVLFCQNVIFFFIYSFNDLCRSELYIFNFKF